MIAYVYRAKDERNWRGRYRLDDEVKLTDISLRTRDKQVAEQRLRDMVRQKEREAVGLAIPKVLLDAAQRPLLDHLDDFVNCLNSLRRDDGYVSLIEFRVKKLATDCGWKTIGDITTDSYQQWRQRQTSLSAKTLNDYLEAARCFLGWLEKKGFTASNPLRSVEKVLIAGSETRHRRAFTDTEIKKLLAVADKRKAVYTMAVYTGLRRSELGELEWGDVDLKANPPVVRVRASTTKNHKPTTIRLHDDVVEQLRLLKPSDVEVDAPVFHGIPRIERFRRDLKKAGVAYRDAQGAVADFHSLRKTFCTNLARMGVSSRVAMALMRHSDRRLTDKVYTDENMLATGAAVESLPSFGVATANRPATHPPQKPPHVLVPVSSGESFLVRSGLTMEVLQGLEITPFSPPESGGVLIGHEEKTGGSDGARIYHDIQAGVQKNDLLFTFCITNRLHQRAH